MNFSTNNLIDLLDRYTFMIHHNQLTQQQQEVLWNRLTLHEPYDRDFYLKYVMGQLIYNSNQNTPKDTAYKH